MAFRGRGGFRFNHKPDKQEPFILYPEDVALPDKKCVTLDQNFFDWNNKLQTYFENSAYLVEDEDTQKAQHCDIEVYSDLSKPRNQMKGALSDYMKLKPGYFPLELLKDVEAPPKKKVKWNNDEESENLHSLFKKIGKKTNEKRENNKEEKEEGEEEDDEENEEEDYSSGGDYEQNEDFDDDEDDFNAIDDGDDEPFF